MYCNKCGKEIEYGTICDECAFEEFKKTRQAPQPVVVEPQQAEWKPSSQNRMYGFGKALAGTIIGFIGIIISYIACIVSAIAPDLGMGVIFVAVACIVLPLIFGISSIKTFKKRARTNCAKPIATLVLGITSLSMLPASVIYTFVAFIISAITNSVYYY